MIFAIILQLFSYLMGYLNHKLVVQVQLPSLGRHLLDQLQCEVLRICCLIADVPVESVLEAYVIDFDIELEGFDATGNLRLVGTITRDCLADCVLDVAFKMSQCGIFRDDQPRKLLWSKVRIVYVPAKLLLVSLPFQLKIKMDGDEDFVSITITFPHDICSSRSENKLLIHRLIERCVPRSARVKTIQPLSKRILDLNMMSFHFPLQPKRQGRVMNPGFSCNIHLFDVILSQRFQHLRPYIFLIDLRHITNQSITPNYYYKLSQLSHFFE